MLRLPGLRFSTGFPNLNQQSGATMNLTNTYRRKLLNAVLYFSRRVRNPSKVKIFKLLYFLDFEHFKETGRSVTNLDYYAFDFGPVPLDFYKEIFDNTVSGDFTDALSIAPFESEETGKKGGMFRAKRPPDLSVFSPREQRILEKLAFMFKDVDARTISDVSHFKNHPWDKTMKEKGTLEKIDYILALDSEADVSIDDALESMKEREEMLKNFPPRRSL